MGGGGRRPGATGAEFRAHTRDIGSKDSHVHILLRKGIATKTHKLSLIQLLSEQTMQWSQSDLDQYQKGIRSIINQDLTPRS